jgi:hypothetical protein
VGAWLVKAAKRNSVITTTATGDYYFARGFYVSEGSRCRKCPNGNSVSQPRVVLGARLIAICHGDQGSCDP